MCQGRKGKRRKEKKGEEDGGFIARHYNIFILECRKKWSKDISQSLEYVYSRMNTGEVGERRWRDEDYGNIVYSSL